METFLLSSRLRVQDDETESTPRDKHCTSEPAPNPCKTWAARRRFRRLSIPFTTVHPRCWGDCTKYRQCPCTNTNSISSLKRHLHSAVGESFLAATNSQAPVLPQSRSTLLVFASSQQHATIAIQDFESRLRQKVLGSPGRTARSGASRAPLATGGPGGPANPASLRFRASLVPSRRCSVHQLAVWFPRQ